MTTPATKLSFEDYTPERVEDHYVIDYSRHGDINAYLAGIYGEKFEDYRRRWKLAQSFELETDFPLYISLETLLKCNFKCGMCPFSVPDELEKIHYPDEMSNEMFDRIVHEAAEHDCPSMGFNTMNEPLMDQQIPERIKKASELGIFDSRMNTNGSLLTENRARRILDSGLARLLVGIDAATKETYDKVRIGGNYTKLMRNVERFLNLREQLNQKTPILRVSYVRMNINFEEQEAFFELWRDVADQVAFQEYRPPSHDEGSFEDRHVGYTKIKPDYSCTQPWERFVIKGNGIITPCCSFHSYKLPQGNLDSTTIYQAWNSPGMKQLRKHMKDRTWEQNPVCNACLKDLTYSG